MRLPLPGKMQMIPKNNPLTLCERVLGGAAVGAGAGAVSGKLADIGIDDGFMKQLGVIFPGDCTLEVKLILNQIV